MTYKIAVVGATGNVGREMLNLLYERNFPAKEIIALASHRSKGKKVSFGDNETLIVQALDEYDFSTTDIALFSPGSKVSAIYAPKAAQAGCIVIDNTSHFRMQPDIPLVVPEVNGYAIENYKNHYIIANPNCSTIQMLVALKPLHDLATIQRIIVSTYQSVSGAGKEAMDELYNQTKSIYMNQKKAPEHFPKQIAFNVIPHIDQFDAQGYTKEEWKMINETQKILDPDIKISATCVRVPVFVGHAESINIECTHDITVQQARDCLHEAPGVTVLDDPDEEKYCTPLDCVREDEVFISRIRQDPSKEHSLNLWVVADNVRKGAALNAIQIAEKLINEYL